MKQLFSALMQILLLAKILLIILSFKIMNN